MKARFIAIALRNSIKIKLLKLAQIVEIFLPDASKFVSSMSVSRIEWRHSFPVSACIQPLEANPTWWAQTNLSNPLYQDSIWLEVRGQPLILKGWSKFPIAKRLGFSLVIVCHRHKFEQLVRTSWARFVLQFHIFRQFAKNIMYFTFF